MNTLEAVNKYIEDNHDASYRGYLGMSEIGEECSRKLWYSYNQYPRKPFDAKTIKRFDDGNRGEDIMFQRLKNAGIKIYGQQQELKDGNFKGHIDGLIFPLENPIEHIWEHKSTEKLPKEGESLKSWNPRYYAQAQMYMHYMDIHQHFMTISSAGERDTVSIITKYNKAYAEIQIQKAHYIIGAKTAPDRAFASASFYQCKWCEFREECYEITNKEPLTL